MMKNVDFDLAVCRLADRPGKWDIVTDCETAGLVAEAVARAGFGKRMKVRSHPWMPVGKILAMRPDGDETHRLR